jgi:DmsE family decaheme c-type cytochrome
MSRFSANNLLKKPSITETCYTCHQQQRMEFKKKSHMPLPEGKMSCADCHNPHGTSGDRLLKADTVNDLCYSCHAEKRGPFLNEHTPVRQNCLNCHLPHGSNNDMGHNFRGVTGNNTGTYNAQMSARSCQVCHPEIHGTNSPSGSRFRN